ncbi:winged helix-turn-helix transcriptional regulator [Sphingomonas sp. Leaf20]|uniref:winged helix-turn-helix transcriptional regulator n=1 Tax=Sphingomonas sp. Leaf20 TaxID=1735685 RepID=UPI00228555EF|nr:winged helix-turn-helix transcriptional regulator [Sphingomonas sp. Leaf20]
MATCPLFTAYGETQLWAFTACTLRALDGDGMVHRTVHPAGPSQVEYTLTDRGHSLTEPLRALDTWVGAQPNEIDGNRIRYDTAGRTEL